MESFLWSLSISSPLQNPVLVLVSGQRAMRRLLPSPASGLPPATCRSSTSPKGQSKETMDCRYFVRITARTDIRRATLFQTQTMLDTTANGF